jgi:choline dehydrogenase
MDVVLSKLPADWPEIAYVNFPAASFQFFGKPAIQSVNNSYATIIPTLMAPHSRGNISIVSSHMSDAPLINPNWLTAQADKDLLVAAFKRVRQFAKSEAIASVVIGDELFPGSSAQTDAQILEAIHEMFMSMSHAHATCQMGKASDPLAVVDGSGRVYEVSSRESYSRFNP